MIYLRCIYIRLLIYLLIQCLHVTLFSDNNKEKLIIDKINIINSSFLNTSIIKHMSLILFLLHLKISECFSLSFSIFNLTHLYRLKAKITVKYTQKIYKIEFREWELLIIFKVIKSENVFSMYKQLYIIDFSIYKWSKRLKNDDESLSLYNAIYTSFKTSVIREQRSTLKDDAEVVKQWYINM